MKVKCEYCEGDFEAKRDTARYCSAKCRVASLRAESEVSVTNPEVSVTPDDELVTLRDTFHGHKVSVTVPASWQADKQAAEMVKAKIPFYPIDWSIPATTTREADFGRVEQQGGRYDRDKVADIW